jgi:hypothetical protein
VDPRLLRRCVDFLAIGETDFLIDLVQRKAGSERFCFKEVDADIVLINEFFRYPLRSAEITAAGSEEHKQQKQDSALGDVIPSHRIDLANMSDQPIKRLFQGALHERWIGQPVIGFVQDR